MVCRAHFSYFPDVLDRVVDTSESLDGYQSKKLQVPLGDAIRTWGRYTWHGESGCVDDE